MTDKQIIIDGVDVSGCINFRSDADTAEASYTNACFIGLMQRWYSNLEPSCIMSCSCKHNPNCYYKQLKRKEQECEELKRATLHIENNREHKANKLNRIEKLILACATGYTDEFIQELLVILHEPEPSSFENKYLQTLADIKPILEFYANSTIGEQQEDGSYKIFGGYITIYDPKPAREALRKIKEVEDVR